MFREVNRLGHGSPEDVVYGHRRPDDGVRSWVSGRWGQRVNADVRKQMPPELGQTLLNLGPA